ncbi:MAG: glucosyl transferase [Ignavibacteriaceae bacterium]|jgi:hypothetical protein|nr:glucosyl transferase [Ignavibacteriaceae bacterium]
MKQATIAAILLSLSLLLKSCNTTEPPDNGNNQDTTSHNFTFQFWTFGEHSSSVLYDVSIIDENNIWAVGEIYLNDSLGQPDPHPYGLVHWDGTDWEVKRITVQNPSGGFSYIIPTGIYVISPTEIWLARGGVFLFNGDSIKQTYWLINYPGYNGGIFSDGESASKLWGTSSQDLYTAGLKGALAHFNGTNWQKIESGTTLNINDIWGIINKDGNKFILCSAYDFGSGGEKKLLSISNNAIGEIPWVENRELYTVWFNTINKIYAGGEGLFYRTKNQWNEVALPALFKFRVRGAEFNDIWTVGGFGFAAHYNGLNWKTFEEVSLASGNYLGLAVNSKTVAMVGNEGNKAIITLGTR